MILSRSRAATMGRLRYGTVTNELHACRYCGMKFQSGQEVIEHVAAEHREELKK